MEEISGLPTTLVIHSTEKFFVWTFVEDQTTGFTADDSIILTDVVRDTDRI